MRRKKKGIKKKRGKWRWGKRKNKLEMGRERVGGKGKWKGISKREKASGRKGKEVKKIREIK